MLVAGCEPEVIAHEVAVAMRAARPAFALTGAGASAESGVAPFRAPGATALLWSGLAAVGYLVAGNGDAWQRWPRVAHFFYERFFLRQVRAATPNACHRFLAERGVPVVTTNVDDLHERAGPAEYAPLVAAVHGTVFAEICAGCGQRREECKHTRASCGYPRPAVLLDGDAFWPHTVADAGLRAAALVDRAKVQDTPLVFVVGVSWARPTFAMFLADLRRAGARIIHVNLAPPPAQYCQPDDAFVCESAAAFFRRCDAAYFGN